MIVELIGCAGAGKTTLRRRICERGISGCQVVAMPDLVLDRAPLTRITNPTAVNVVQELRSLPFFLTSLRVDGGFVSYAYRRFADHAPSAFVRWNGMRGIVRKIGMYNLARSRAAEAIVLSDEGTLLSSYNLYIATGSDFDESDLEEFARLVPLPDLVLYVRTPVPTLVERATSRPDPRPQHVRKTAAEIEDDVQRTVDLFDLLVSMPQLRGRVVTIEEGDLTGEEEGKLGGELADRLRASAALATRKAPAGRSIGSAPATNLKR